MSLIRTVQLGLLLGLVAACSEGQQTERGEVQRRDSAGIVIIETPGTLARAPIGWSIGHAPELQLGSAAGPESDQFHEIGGRFAGGITALPDGRIVVVNGVSAELLFFGRDGRFLNRLNKKGNGPGEFRRAYLVPYTSNDSLLIRDTGHTRYTLFSTDGQMHRSFMPDRPGVMVGTVGGVSESGIVITALLDAVPLVEGQQTRPMVVRWISMESGRADTVARFNMHSYFVPDVAGTPIEIPVLFTTSPSATVGVQGFFVIGGDTPDIRAFDNTGRLIRIFRVAGAPRPVTPEDVDGAIDFQVPRWAPYQSGVRRAYEQMDIPNHWPTFQSVRVDRLGWIWAELFRTTKDATPRWMVFDSSGVARGVVDLPPGFEVQDIGPDQVLGRWLDDLRVEHVRRYRLERNR
ncbi:MAG: 6-bladed beta-propeller [Longimicrobiales bacterium]